jgi:hypothetical protein
MTTTTATTDETERRQNWLKLFHEHLILLDNDAAIDEFLTPPNLLATAAFCDNYALCMWCRSPCALQCECCLIPTCSKECALSSWPAHKKICKRMKDWRTNFMAAVGNRPQVRVLTYNHADGGYSKA